MLTELLRTILNEHKNYMTLSELEKILDSKKIKVRMKENSSPYFMVSSGYVFVKKALISMKNEFLKEFEEYIASRSIDIEAARHLRGLYAHFVPDVFYPIWHEAPLETRLLIFDLLLSLLVQNKNTNDRLKRYFGNVLDLYCLVATYSLLLIRDNDDHFENITGYLKTIDPEEELLKNILFELLSDPGKAAQTIDEKEQTLAEIAPFIDSTIDASFRVSMKYSQHLLKKVMTNELARFEPLYLLSRFEFDSLYEWALALIECEEWELSGKLLKDLGL